MKAARAWPSVALASQDIIPEKLSMKPIPSPEDVVTKLINLQIRSNGRKVQSR